jgi:SAM-dependent methyltransferase
VSAAGETPPARGYPPLRRGIILCQTPMPEHARSIQPRGLDSAAEPPPELTRQVAEDLFRDTETTRHKADVERNRAAWNRWAPDYFMAGLEAWQSDEPHWGTWKRPESELALLDSVGERTDVVELGCGTAASCSWMARRGAIPVGVDVSEAQIENARVLQNQFGISFPLVRASADSIPFADESFDVVLSEYGASTWVDPSHWLPEAGRLLRPGGVLVFVVHSPTLMACTPEVGDAIGPHLVRDHFGMGRCLFPDDDTVEYHLGHPDWIRLLRAQGFSVEELVEVRPPDGATARWGFVSAEWARRWPSEEVWKARKLG